MKDIIYSFLQKLLRALKKLFGAQKRHLLFCLCHFPQNAPFESCDILSRLPRRSMVLYLDPYILKMSTSEASESNCRDSFISCSEYIDVWSESGSELKEEIFEEQ